MPVRFLTDAQRERSIGLSREIPAKDLFPFFTFTGKDRRVRLGRRFRLGAPLQTASWLHFYSAWRKATQYSGTASCAPSPWPRRRRVLCLDTQTISMNRNVRRDHIRKPIAAVGSAVFFLVGPGVVVGLIPW
jgi:hypothetical protein